ncbi:hypothetical protein FACUT_2632 [Fusarium acutatum]|uniref:Uncharacterized protein n=1 Tax=Fusarium acutatum TaxID=78861 RepID=A0A8H4K2I0_9HYPO|nr:hypothetical protein FACUT_2632 [Fusarium acutatum]
MAVPIIAVSFSNATPGSLITRAVTSPVEWDHYYSGARFSENQDIKMNRPQGGEYGSLYDVEEEGLDENFVYGRLSPVPAPRRESKTLSELNGYLPGYRFVGNRYVEMDEADVKYEGSFHEFTFEYPFLPAEDFERFSGCWREDDYEADVSEPCFEESSEENSDAGGSSGDDNVSNAHGNAPRKLSDMEDIYWGLRKRKFNDFEQGRIEEDEFEDDEFDEDESEDVRLEEPCPDPSDDEMDMEHVLDCGSEFYFNSTDAPQDHEYSLEDYTFQGDDVKFEEFPRRLQTIPEVDEPESPFPYGYAEHVPEVTHADEGLGLRMTSIMTKLCSLCSRKRVRTTPILMKSCLLCNRKRVMMTRYTDEIVLGVEEEEGEDDNGPYFNDAQLDLAEVKYTFV